MNALLRHRSSVVRKSVSTLLAMKRKCARHYQSSESLCTATFVNSIPKSGTHLLDQIVAALPDRVDYGTFISSMTSSFRFRERSQESTIRQINGILDCELVRGHLFHDDIYAAELHERCLSYFIYRDPRDVVVSEAWYLTHMNRWHRLHAEFRKCPSFKDAILLAIRGLDGRPGQKLYPSVNDRFRRYEGWIHDPRSIVVRFEDLVSDQRIRMVEKIVDHFVSCSSIEIERSELVTKCMHAISPRKSHTMRKGKKGGWLEIFDNEIKDEFKGVASPLLVRLGYEEDDSW